MEKTAFAERNWALFHKRDLAAAGAGEALPHDMQAAISGRTPVVGVVVNTIDDALDKGGRPPWTAELVQQLLDILGTAQEAGRVVLFVSDHGHVHERGSRLEADDSGGTLWRCSPRPAGADEVELAGPRVLLGGGRIVAAWNEKLRYGPRRNGYHGGASAQEVVIPLALLARQELDIPGWVPVYHPEPDWWVGEPLHTAAPPAAIPGESGKPRAGKKRTATPAESVASPALFEVVPAEAVSWIDQLLGTEVMTQRLSRLRCGAMPADQLAVLLKLLDSRGGTATRVAVARALDVPEAQLGSQIAAAQRVSTSMGTTYCRWKATQFGSTSRCWKPRSACGERQPIAATSVAQGDVSERRRREIIAALCRDTVSAALPRLATIKGQQRRVLHGEVKDRCLTRQRSVSGRLDLVRGHRLNG